jgi:hypothetical protein
MAIFWHSIAYQLADKIDFLYIGAIKFSEKNNYGQSY